MSIEQCKEGIMVIYMDVQGLNKNKANELIAEIVNIYKIDGFNPIFIPSNISKVEIIWRGYEIEKNYSLNNKNLNDMILKLEECSDIEDVKKLLRLIKINNIKK